MPAECYVAHQYGLNSFLSTCAFVNTYAQAMKTGLTQGYAAIAVVTNSNESEVRVYICQDSDDMQEVEKSKSQASKSKWYETNKTDLTKLTFDLVNKSASLKDTFHAAEADYKNEPELLEKWFEIYTKIQTRVRGPNQSAQAAVDAMHADPPLLAAGNVGAAAASHSVQGMSQVAYVNGSPVYGASSSPSLNSGAAGSPAQQPAASPIPVPSPSVLPPAALRNNG